MGAVRKAKPMAEPGVSPLLGVSASARGNRWHDRLAPEARPIATAIAQRHGLPELIARVPAAKRASPKRLS